MANSLHAPNASGHAKQGPLADGKADKKQASHFEHRPSTARSRPGSPLAKAEELQTSACFDAWAKPEDDLDGPIAH